MPVSEHNWTILVYRIPSQPTRHRLMVWRKLQRMGALYLQDAVCLLPARPDLDENMQYIAQSITEMGGSYHLFKASPFTSDGARRLVKGFRDLADASMNQIAGRIDGVSERLKTESGQECLDAGEEDLKRERAAFLRSNRLAYFGSDRAKDIEDRLAALHDLLEDLRQMESRQN